MFAFACFVQTVAGFGSGLIASPLLMGMGLLTPNEAVAMMAAVWVAQDLGMLLRYHPRVVWPAAGRLLAGLVPGIALGVIGRHVVPEAWVLAILGLITAGYALYSWVRPHLPELHHPRWGYLFGLGAGALDGAYTTGGPPVVIYASLRRWDPAEFRGTFGAVFLVSAVLIVASSAAAGDYSPTVLTHLATGFAGFAVGFPLGLVLNRWINPPLFRRIVLILLLVIGVRLLARAWEHRGAAITFPSAAVANSVGTDWLSV